MENVDPVKHFSGVHMYTEEYKQVHGQPVLTDILIPKTLKPGKHPLIIYWHGGYLVTGSRNHAPWFVKWILDYAARTSAIIVSSDYRLMPEATMTDVNVDLEDLWQWVHKSLPGALAKHAPEHEVDLSRILVYGGSAGGYCAIQQSLDHPDEIRATIAMYPMVDMYEGFVTHGLEQELGEGMAFSEAEVDEYIKNIPAGRVVTGGVPPDRSRLTGGVINHRKLVARFGEGKNLCPVQRVRAGGRLPKRVFIAHGTKDAGVPIEEAEKFVAEAKKVEGNEGSIMLWAEEGADHGYDNESKLDDEWLATGLRFVEDAWLDMNTERHKL